MYIYMHVCICTRMGVSVGACLALCTGRHQSAILSQHSGHLYLQWLSSRGAGVSPPPWPLVSGVGLQSFRPFVCSKADWLRVREGAAPPLSSAYFIGSSSFNRFSCAGYINSVLA